MKTALLITGEYRTFDIAIKTWDHLRGIPVDVYFATWEGPTRHQIEQALTHLPLATVQEIRIEKAAVAMPGRYGPAKMIYLWKIAAMMSCPVQYDAMILTRPDIMCAGVLPDLQAIDSSSLYVLGADQQRMSDQLFVGSQVVITALSQVPYPANYTEIHSYLADQLKAVSKVCLRELNPYAVVRENVDPSQELTFAYVRACAKQWWEATHGQSYEG
jgi:hypothetical protein